MGLSNLFMRQRTWVIDPVNGNNRNSGVDKANALKNDRERQARMGPNPTWLGGAYHLRYLNDLPPSDEVRIEGYRYSDTNVTLHGSTVDGQGQTNASTGSIHDTLYTGTINTLGALNRTSNVSWQLLSAGLPTSWTASGLIDHRIRLTSGNTGAKAWPWKDLLSKTAHTTAFTPVCTYGLNFSSGHVTTAPASGNTFVVERLTKIPNIFFDLHAIEDFSVNTGQEKNVCESLDLGEGNLVMGGADFWTFDGCRMRLWADNPAGQSQFKCINCAFDQQLVIPPAAPTPALIFAGYAHPAVVGENAVLVEAGSGQGFFDLDFMAIGAPIAIETKNAIKTGHVACFDSSTSGIVVLVGGQLLPTSTSDPSGRSMLWGNGATNYGMLCRTSSRVVGPFTASLTGAQGDLRLGGRTYSWSEVPSNVTGGQLVDAMGGGGIFGEEVFT